MDTTTATSVADAKVQHVTKKSSDELLRKFADEAPQKKKDLRVSKRQKIMSRGMRREDQYDSPLNGGAAVVERRSLLLPAVTRRSVLLQRIRARDMRNKSLLRAIQKTWCRTLEGASRVFMEKHYHRHKRLINDIV